MDSFRESCEPPHGMRFWRNDISLKLRGYAMSSRLTPPQLLAFAENTNHLSDTLRDVTPWPVSGDVLVLGDFPTLQQPKIFKTLAKDTWISTSRKVAFD
jgi:hypothetical protein